MRRCGCECAYHLWYAKNSLDKIDSTFTEQVRQALRHFVQVSFEWPACPLCICCVYYTGCMCCLYICCTYRSVVYNTGCTHTYTYYTYRCCGGGSIREDRHRRHWVREAEWRKVSLELPQSQIANTNTNVYSQYLVYKKCNDTITQIMYIYFWWWIPMGVFEKPLRAFWDPGYPGQWQWQIVFIEETAFYETIKVSVLMKSWTNSGNQCNRMTANKRGGICSPPGRGPASGNHPWLIKI